MERKPFVITLGGEMNHVRIVANGFRVLGLTLGIPAVALLFTFGGSLFALHHQPASDPSHPLDINKYGIVGLLQNGAIGLGKGLEFLSGVGLWAATIMAVLALVVFLLAGILFLTGRGIAARRRWARIAGIMFCVLTLLAAWTLAFNVPRDGIVAVMMLVAVTIYALWILGWRYAAPR